MMNHSRITLRFLTASILMLGIVCLGVAQSPLKTNTSHGSKSEVVIEIPKRKGVKFFADGIPLLGPGTTLLDYKGNSTLVLPNGTKLMLKNASVHAEKQGKQGMRVVISFLP